MSCMSIFFETDQSFVFLVQKSINLFLWGQVNSSTKDIKLLKYRLESFLHLDRRQSILLNILKILFHYHSKLP